MDQVTQLAKTKASLEADLRATLQKAATAMRNEQKLLLQENELLSQQLVAKAGLLREMEEQMTQLSQNKETAEQERDTSRRELQELLECREFIEQENQVCRTHLREVEEELKASRSTLWERNAQLEDLKDAHQTLRQEQEALCRELATCKAELQHVQGTVEKVRKALLELRKVQAQFSGLVDSLQEEAADSTQEGRTCTPSRQAPQCLGSSFVDSVLRAAAERDLETPGIGSKASAFTKTAATALPKPEEVEQRLAVSIQELQDAADQICHLTTQQQKAAQEEVRSLKAEILQLEHQQEALESQLKADQDSHAAHVAELSKTLYLHRQNEKELQEALCLQDEKQQRLIDQRREVMNLREEVSQQEQALRKAETEVAVLWEELRGARVSDVGWVQEKIQLSQEVGKLRELLLEKDSEHSQLVPLLQEQLYQARQRLKRSKQIAEEMRQAFTRLDTEVAGVSELYHLLDLLE
ncbi:sperm-associated antigen 5 [Heteronotia binoei]|uniref:sperm-associated antigen 5 n=1 Tax=Heteronotia binoei TaxID=13085 RepID=UPI00292F9EEB|nr:sperm-associated antigen 5 [Heteronotia binoei]